MTYGGGKETENWDTRKTLLLLLLLLSFNSFCYLVLFCFFLFVFILFSLLGFKIYFFLIFLLLLYLSVILWNIFLFLISLYFHFYLLSVFLPFKNHLCLVCFLYSSIFALLWLCFLLLLVLFSMVWFHLGLLLSGWLFSCFSLLVLFLFLVCVCFCDFVLLVWFWFYCFFFFCLFFLFPLFNPLYCCDERPVVSWYQSGSQAWVSGVGDAGMLGNSQPQQQFSQRPPYESMTWLYPTVCSPSAGHLMPNNKKDRNTPHP